MDNKTSVEQQSSNITSSSEADFNAFGRWNLGQLAAIATWAAVFGISLNWLNTSAPAHIQMNTVWIVLSFITYIVAFIIVSKPSSTLSLGQSAPLVILQLLAAFAIMLLIPISFLPILTIIWVAVLPHFMSIKKTAFAVLVVVICWFNVYAWRWEASNIIPSAVLWSTFHFFVILMTQQTIMAEQSAEESARLTKELQSAQYLLEQATRQNERTRIARDLHDLVGHHLTALIINLQVAGHLSEGEAQDKVNQCHSIAKLLLSDVREAVSTMRESQSLEFKTMIDLMIKNIPKITVHNQIDTDLNLDDIALAKVLLNCIQEAVTNCLRHSGATEFWITINQKENWLNVELFDNGQSVQTFVKGNGLIGMEERVAALNGEIVFSKNNKAMQINIKIPLSQPSTRV